MGNYKDYFRDPRWQKKRLKVLKNDDFSCQVCGDGAEELHVHHKYYTDDKKPWEYPEDALITLCKGCHEIETLEISSTVKRFCIALRGVFLSNEIKDITFGVKNINTPYPPDVMAAIISKTLSTKELTDKMCSHYWEALKNG